MLKFKKLVINNFRSIKHMEVNLDNNGIVIVVGNNKDTNGESSNGAAKSSIFYAILYSLYGKIPYSSSSDSIINEQEGKNTSVELSFNLAGHDYMVKRYRKHSEFKNKVLLYEGSNEITLPTNKGTDKKIVETLGINMNTMLNSIIFGSSSVNSFVSATDKERKSILEELSNVSIYKETQSIIKESKRDLSDSLIESKSNLSSIITKKQSINAVKDSYASQIKNKEQRIKDIKYQLSVITPLDSKKMNMLLEEKESLNRKIDKLDKETNKYVFKDTSDISNLLIKEKSFLLKAKDSANTLVSLIKEDKKDAVSIKSSPNAICKLCGNVLDAKHKAKELSRLENEIKSSTVELNKLSQDFKSHKSVYLEANSSFNKLKEYNNSIKDIQVENNKKYKDIRNRLSSVENIIEKNSMTLTNIDDLKVQLKKEEAIVVEKPSLLLEEIPNVEKVEKIISDKEHRLDMLNELVKVFGDKGVKSQVLGLAIPYINSKMQEYLNILSDGSLNAFISKEENSDGTKTQRLGILVSSLTASNNYDDLSSGEKKRVSIALNLSFLSYLSSKFGGVNICVFDEVFDSLDEVGIESVISLLKVFSKDMGSVFVISHLDNLKYNDDFDKRLVVSKEEGISKIESFD